MTSSKKDLSTRMRVPKYTGVAVGVSYHPPGDIMQLSQSTIEIDCSAANFETSVSNIFLPWRSSDFT
jgi:hypothetical protein